MSEHVSTTPAGHQIVFEDGLPDPETGKSKRRSYTVDGEKLVSVTTVLNVLDKPALLHWSQKVGISGAIALAQEGALPLYLDAAMSALKARELLFWQVSQKAADRGTLAHEDLLRFATGAEIPDLDQYPEEQRGFLMGVAGFYADHRPEAIDSETPVCAPSHGYAGRYDLRAHMKGEPWLLDLKTTETLARDKKGNVKPPYPESLLQLEGYEIAALESGYGASLARGVVRVDSTGAYDLTESWAEPEDWLGVLAAYRATKALSARRKAKAAA